MDTNVILQFRRGTGTWQCPECDTENRETSERCSVCGYKRTGMEQVVYDAPVSSAPQGYSDGGAYEKKPTAPVASTPGTAKKTDVPRIADTGPLSAPKKLTGDRIAGSSGSGKSESGNGWIGGLIAVIVVIAVIVLAVAFS